MRETQQKTIDDLDPDLKNSYDKIYLKTYLR